MITPDWREIIPGITLFATIHAPFRLMSNIASQASSLSS